MAYVVLTAASLCYGFRLIVGPSLSDRINAVNGLLVVGMASIATRAAQTTTGGFLNVLIVLTLVSFIGTAMLARFIEGRGQ